MAAGSLLSHAGAGRSLDALAWSAAYSYYGHDLFGVTYANQVLARAVAWQRDGFCPNCALDDGLVAKFERRFGASVRRQLVAAERRKKHKKHKKHKRDRKGDRHRRHKRGDRDSDDRARDRKRRKRRSRPPSAKKEVSIEPSPPSQPRGNTESAKPPPEAPATPPTTARPPQPAECSPIRKLLGCKP